MLNPTKSPCTFTPHAAAYLLTNDSAEGDDAVANGEEDHNSQGGFVDEGGLVVGPHHGALGRRRVVLWKGIITLNITEWMVEGERGTKKGKGVRGAECGCCSYSATQHRS